MSTPNITTLCVVCLESMDTSLETAYRGIPHCSIDCAHAYQKLPNAARLNLLNSWKPAVHEAGLHPLDAWDPKISEAEHERRFRLYLQGSEAFNNR